MVHSLNKFRNYITRYKVLVHTNHATIKYLMNKINFNARIIGWLSLLQQFDLVDIDDYGNDAKVSDDSHHQQEWLQAQIMKLDVEYREPLFLQVVGGFSGEEIGDILDLNKNTVMTRLFRARNQLKEMLDSQDTKRGQKNG